MRFGACVVMVGCIFLQLHYQGNSGGKQDRFAAIHAQAIVGFKQFAAPLSPSFIIFL
jgi:hypothetical protein